MPAQLPAAVVPRCECCCQSRALGIFTAPSGPFGAALFVFASGETSTISMGALSPGSYTFSRCCRAASFAEATGAPRRGGAPEAAAAPEPDEPLAPAAAAAAAGLPPAPRHPGSVYPAEGQRQRQRLAAHAECRGCPPAARCR